MSTKNQAEKNFKLSEKLADFLVSHPEESKKLPDNEVNEKLIKELLEEGKHVVKTQETNNEKQPWEFSPVTA